MCYYPLCGSIQFLQFPYEVQESDLWVHIKASFTFEILVKYYMIWHEYIEK